MFLSLGKEDLPAATTAEVAEIAAVQVNALCNLVERVAMGALANYAEVHLGWITADAVNGIHVLRAGRHYGDHVTQRFHSDVISRF